MLNLKDAKTYPLIPLLLLLIACAAVGEGSPTPFPHTATPWLPPPDFTPEQARERLEQHIAHIPFFSDALIARASNLDVAGLYAFAVVPASTREAGQVFYLVGSDELLSSAQPYADFDKLMLRLGVGQTPHVLDVQTFARLFISLRALRRGAVLESADGHVLLRPEQLPPEQFTPPQVEFDAAGAHYTFWMFDIDRREPVK